MATPDENVAPLALPADAARELRRASAPLGPLERAHLLLRLASAPWARVLERLEHGGSLVDVGCGPGLLAHLLERAGYAGAYLGVDPDARKIGRARRWLEVASARRFEVGSVAAAAPGGFSQAVLVDVLYLVAPAERDAFLSGVAQVLSSGGLFVALTSGGGPGWKRTLDGLQERAAVALGVTRGETVATCDGAEVAARARRAGLVSVEVADVGRGYVHGFELVLARRPR